MTYDEALEHPWLSLTQSELNRMTLNIEPRVLMDLKCSRQAHELHYETLIIFTQILDSDETKLIRETFQALDSDNGGTIEVAELRTAYNNLQTKI